MEAEAGIVSLVEIPRDLRQWNRVFGPLNRALRRINDVDGNTQVVADFDGKMAIQVNGVSIGSNFALNLIEGSKIQIAAVASTSSIDITFSLEALVDGDIPGSIARDTEVSAGDAATYAAGAADLAAHVASATPHPALTTTNVAEGSNLYYTDARAQAAARLWIVRSISATGGVNATDDVILADATGGAITLNLPAAASSTNRRLVVKKIDSSGNAVTLDGNAAETIDGAGTLALATQWAHTTIVCNGTAWFVI